jgi:hypothetical protein
MKLAWNIITMIYIYMHVSHYLQYAIEGVPRSATMQYLKDGRKHVQYVFFKPGAAPFQVSTHYHA